MTKRTLRTRDIGRWRTTAGAVVVSGLFAMAAFAQSSPPAHEMHHAQVGSTHHAQSGAKAGEQTMKSRCQEMMAARQTMMSDIASANAKLQDLVKRMDGAQGEAKVAATADVVRELVAQRARAVEMMTEMQPKMMGHMMEHMQPATTAARGNMAECPMMKGMAGSNHSMQPGGQPTP